MDKSVFYAIKHCYKISLFHFFALNLWCNLKQANFNNLLIVIF